MKNSNKQGEFDQVHSQTLINELLVEFKDLFAELVTLPPTRTLDHSIKLKPNTKPVNIRSYCYSPIQKTEIEKMVKEMLKQSFIRPSQSPFASLVLLVKKKYGSWHFCMDYRQLNALTIKDKYPIPLKEDLIDKLHNAKFSQSLTFVRDTTK